MTDGSSATPEVDPIARLLELGEPRFSRDFAWPDYQSFGITSTHIPALIQIATDTSLIHLPDDNDPRGWAPIHAWRALGQLQAQEAIEPLLRLFHEIRDNEWVTEEMPDVFAMIGPAAFPALAAYLEDPSYPAHSRLVAATSLMQIALSHPEMRDQSVQVLAEQLAGFEHNVPGVNSILIANLVELRAVEKADLIQKVFTDGKVDRFLVGDWRDIRHRLRSISTRQTPGSLARSVGSIPPDPTSQPAYQEPRTTPRSNPDMTR
jgi:hypothetical protein